MKDNIKILIKNGGFAPDKDWFKRIPKKTGKVRIPSHFDHPFYKERQSAEKKKIRKINGKTNHSKLPVGSRQCDMPVNPLTGKRFCLRTKRKQLHFLLKNNVLGVWQALPNKKLEKLFDQEVISNRTKLNDSGTLSQMEGGMDNLANDRMLRELGIEPDCGFYTVAFDSDGVPFAAWRNPRGRFLTILEDGRKF